MITFKMKKPSINTTTPIKDYYLLTKPGIVRGNLITAAAGFIFASRGDVEGLRLAMTLAGIGLIIAAACVFNNIIDRNIDRNMGRTKKRAMAAKTIAIRTAIIYGALLGTLGFVLLAAFTNLLTVILGVVALFSYVVLYGYAKRRSVHGTLVGTLPGALPITAGYTAVSGRLDVTAMILFAILIFWQMPHFYSIAIYRYKDYKAAGLPVLTVVKGIRAAKVQIVAYIVGFLLAVSSLYLAGSAGKIYLAVMVVVGLWWLALSLKGFSGGDQDDKWAANLMGVSLVVLLTFSIMISIQHMLPV